MIENYLSTGWHAIAPGLADHLWQSTLVALVAALLTLALRNHDARARYWLWLAASLKFLVPFSLLVGIGSHFAWRPSATTASTNLYFAIEEVSRPFTQATTRIPPQPASVLSSFPWIPVSATVRLCGFLGVRFAGSNVGAVFPPR